MRKEFLQILRDPHTLYIVLAIPVVKMFLLGYTTTTDVRNIPLAVVDFDRSSSSRRLVDAYRAADYFRLAFDVDSENQLRELIDGGEARAGLIIPADFGERLLGGSTAQVSFVLDGSDPSVASTAHGAAELVGQSVSSRIALERIQAAGLAGLRRPAWRSAGSRVSKMYSWPWRGKNDLPRRDCVFPLESLPAGQPYRGMLHRFARMHLENPLST
jgi:ABC-2 type transport system permease protein